MIVSEWALERRDIPRIFKLNELTNKATFWNDVRKLTKNVHSCHAINRWQILAEGRFEELTKQGV